MKVVPTGVSQDGTRHYEVTGLLGAPKEIPGIQQRDSASWSMAGRGPDLIHPRPPREGEAITVITNGGSIRIRVSKVRDDGAMIGGVEILNTPSGMARDIHGIRYRDSVIVRGMPFVNIVHTD